MEKKTIIVIGAGRGLGNHIAERFGRENFRVVLMARNVDSLKEYEKELETEGIETYIHTVDAVNPETITEALNWVKETLGTPDVLVYNVGITAQGNANPDNSEIMRHYQVDVASAYHSVCEIATDDFARKHGAIIITGGAVALYPMSMFTPLSLDKSALRTMVYMLNEQLGQRGIYVGTVTVGGSIGMDKFFSPENIANDFWELYQNRNKVEIVNTYPELLNSNLSGSEYWTKVYQLKGSQD